MRINFLLLSFILAATILAGCKNANKDNAAEVLADSSGRTEEAPADFAGEASNGGNEQPSTQAQAGLLTAGYIDDNVNFELFSKYKAEFLKLNPQYPNIESASAEDNSINTPATELDLAFVVDSTGSMSDEIEYLKKEINSISNQIFSAYPNVAVRYALIVYRDHGDEYVTRVFNFADDLQQFEQYLNQQSASGGGDYPEAMEIAMADAMQLSWRDSARRMLFLVGDAPPHTENAPAFLDHVKSLKSKDTRIYPIAASGVADEAEYLMRIAAQVTKARYLFLTDDSGIGDTHAVPHIPCFRVQLLKDVMIQMISSEIEGVFKKEESSKVLREVGKAEDNGQCIAVGG